MRSYWLDLSNPAHQILYKFGLSARGKTELEILKELSHGSVNMYELKKRLRAHGRIDVHYSTVLRALRRLEDKKLVRVVSQKETGRHEKTYACTLVGELVVALAKNGLTGAARIIAESSKSFSECVRLHDSNYLLLMAESIIWNILNSETGETVKRSDLDFYVRKVELEWVKANIVKALTYNPSQFDFDNRDYFPLPRTDILRFLRKTIHISWISNWIVQVIEKYVEKENEWLQALEDFKREVKLAQIL